MRLKRLVVVMLMLLMSACGSGGKDKVGSIVLTATPASNGDGTYSVSASATYTHPTITNLVGVEITFNTSPAGLVAGFPTTISTNSAGNAGVLLTVNQLATAYSFVVTASTGSLQDSKTVSIPAL